VSKNDGILRGAIHVVACICFIVFPYIFWHGPYHEEDRNLFHNPFFRKDMLCYCLLVVFFYLNYYILIPRFYFAKKLWSFWFSIIGGFVLVIALPPLISLDMLSYVEKMEGPLPPGELPPISYFFFHQVEHNFLRFVAVFVLSLLLRVNEQWKTAQKEKISAELSYLRAQINPHFLFNTLNSIYSMAIDRSEHTATAVVKLSAMMRYAITEAHKDYVPLEKEINYIADYVDLQNFRLGHTVKLSHRVSGDPAGKKIAPLVLISIVENAFKYGVNPEENSSIMVDLTVHEYFLVFLVRNNKVRTNVGENERSGIGVENTRNRLQMIYPGKHKFEIQENSREFSVLLTLQLT
jgi:hypothetical protein